MTERDRPEGKGRQQLRVADGEPDLAGPGYCRCDSGRPAAGGISLFDLAVDVPAGWGLQRKQLQRVRALK